MSGVLSRALHRILANGRVLRGVALVLTRFPLLYGPAILVAQRLKLTASDGETEPTHPVNGPADLDAEARHCYERLRAALRSTRVPR